MRLIDADKLPVRSIDETDLPSDKGLLVVLKEDIDNAPTVRLEYLPNYANCQSVEMIRLSRPHGEWGKHGECPFCSYIRKWKEDNFCGNCGAHLRKGDKEE